MTFKNSLLIIVSLLFFFSSCKMEDGIFDHPFVYITDQSNGSSSVVSCKGTVLAEYKVYLSSKTLNQNLDVVFQCIPGDGLKEGVDYKIVTTSSTLKFPSGTYERVIRIEWLPNPIDVSKNNSLRIKIVSNSADFTIGFPGPDKLFSEYTITKTN